MKKVIIGGGASGLMAAYSAASHGHETLLLEKNEKAGKKLYITGKGRCNLTNDCSSEDLLAHVVHGQKFLRGAAYRFSPADTMDFMRAHGLALKTERGGRVFPASDKASDVTATLLRACKEAGADIRYGVEVSKIDVYDSTVRGIITTEGHIPVDAVIVATGGRSYPSTGSTGDGYRFAAELGHTVTPLRPSLVGMNADGLAAAQGITLKNCVLTAKRGGKVLFSELGELLFTHYGVSGPLVLSLSALACRLPVAELEVTLDFKPALDAAKLEARILRDLAERKNEQMKNVMRGLLPAGLVGILLSACGISPSLQANALTKESRTALVHTLKAFPLRVKSLRGFEEAVVTSGGVSLSEVDPATMASRLVKGLYFCGEVLDVDAFTGGYNLQIAFSTGYLAGIGAKNA